MSQGLLEKLAEEMEIPYLSDLRMPFYRKRLVQYLIAIHGEAYSQIEWRDAIQYILGKSSGSFRNGKEAKDYLIEQLKK